MGKADEMHDKDRRHDETWYIHHQIRIILSFIKKYEEITGEDVIIFMLHDVLEDHPEYWREVYDMVWVHLFRSILVLATGWILMEYRKEMLEFFHREFSDWEKINFADKIIPWLHTELDIMRILNPADPIFRLNNEFQYTEIYWLQDSQKIRAAIELYRDDIIIPKTWIKQCYDDEEYIALGNYLYFTKDDARRKLQDMLDNMSDMEAMEKIKPGYTEKRRVKAYILWVKLKNFGMTEEYAELLQAFENAWKAMYTDVEVLLRLKDLSWEWK